MVNYWKKAYKGLLSGFGWVGRSNSVDYPLPCFVFYRAGAFPVVVLRLLPIMGRPIKGTPYSMVTGVETHVLITNVVLINT